MAENADNPTPITPPHGQAEAQARALSTGMGALAGGAMGALVGFVGSFFAGRRGIIGSMVWTAIGAVTGYLLSAAPWNSAAKTPAAPAPQLPPAALPVELTQPAASHAGRIASERAAAAMEPQGKPLH